MRDEAVGRRWKTTCDAAMEGGSKSRFSEGEAGLKASELPLGGLGLGAVVEQVALAGEVDLHALLDGVWAREVPVAPRNPAAALAFCG